MNESTDPSRPAPMRRLALLGLVFVAAILSCGKDVTGPLGAAARYVRGLAFAPQFPPAFQAVGGAGSGVVQFSKVHVVLHHSDGSVALDTTIDFPAGADSLTVDLTVKLLPDAPAEGEPMTLNLGYINAAGDTVFKGGPVSLTAAPPPAGGGPNPPVKVPVSYTGPGSTATTVLISPRGGTVVAGSGFSFSAVAKDQNGIVLPGTPIIWNSVDPTIATITSPAAGNGTAQQLRGTARIIAELFSGAADTVQLNVTLPASQIILQSGNAQTGVVGTNLAAPLVVKVAASDGIGVANTTVNFAVASGGGSVSNASVVSDANGLAQTTLKLGTLVGANSVTATATGLTNSPLTFTATAQAATATKLVVTTQPVNGVAGTALANVVFTAQDNNGNTATSFTGSVAVAFGTNTPNATLSGTLTVSAVAGVATFSNLLVNKNGTVYTLVASSTGLTSVTTSAFDIAVGAPKLLVFSAQPTTAVVGAAISPAIVVNAQDSQGNPTPAFTGAVALGFAINNTGATLGGTATVNAVAGVATFSGITVSAAGTGYALSASATGLTSATSAPFNVGGGVATSMVVASGAGQTGAPGAALASPIVIQVNDAGGNGIAGSTVNFAVVTGGGSVLPTSGVTNGSGQVQTVWTLGPGLGAQSISATSAGLAGSPLTINATAAVGAATQLVITVQPTNTVAGVAIAPAITVTAKDALNNTVPSYVANVSLAFGANPGGSTLSGVTTIAAVAGVATFNSVSLNKAAAGYTLVASSGALTAATTTAFNITNAAAATLAITAGQGQTGSTSTALGTPLGVTVTDAFGNPVAGTTVNWAAGGGGSMAPASSVTNAAGVATSTWTLGASAGAQTATATSGVLAGSPATFNATATVAGFSKTWTGATSTTWAVATNWSPVGVPVAGDSVFIPSGGNQPSISAAVTLKHLTIAAGALLSFVGSPAVTITGNLTDNGGMAGNGTMVLSGAGTLSGGVSPSLTISGTYSLAGAASAVGATLVTGSLNLNGHALGIAVGSFTTSGSGTITMMNAADALSVSGSATFAGGASTLTNGTLAVTGAFAQTTNASAFSATAPHSTVLNGAAAQTVNFANAGASGFGNVTFANSAGVTLQTNVVANNVTAASGTVSGPGIGLSMSGTLTDPLGLTSVAAFSFATSATPVSATTPVITLAGGGGVTFNGPAALAANLTVNGGVSVNSAVGSIAPNGHTLTVNGSFGTSNNGTLVMNAAADALTVNGNVTFSGGNSSGLLTNGAFTFTGNFTQTNSSGGAEFSPAGAHNTFLSGGGAQSISFATPDTANGSPCSGNVSCFGTLIISKSSGAVTFATPVHANGSMNIMSGVTSVTQTAGTVGAPSLVTVKNNLSTTATVAPITFTRLATKGTISVGASTVLDTIIFAGTAAQTVPAGNYNVVYFNGTPVIGGNIVTTGDVIVGAFGTLNVGGKVITIGGSLFTQFGGVLGMAPGDSVTVAGNATFNGNPSTPTGGVLQIAGNFSQGAVTNSFAANSPHITRFTGATPTISFANPATSNFGTLQLQTSAGAAFATNAATAGDVWMKTGTTPSATGAGTVSIGGALYDSTGGRWQVANTTMTGTTGGTLPKFITTNLAFSNAVTLGDSVHVTGNVSSSGPSASLDLNSHKMKVSGNFATSTSGVFKMTHAADTMIVNGNASFNGGSTAGLLTNGLFEFNGGSFTQGTIAAAYAATSPHVTYFWGANPQNINFANPGAGSSHFGILYLGDTSTVLASDVIATGQFQTGITINHEVRSTGADHLLTSDGADMRNTRFVNVRWKIAGVNGNGSFPSIDNVFFDSTLTTAAQLEFDYSVTTNLTLVGFSFNTPPTTGSYIKIVGPDTLTMSSVYPGANGGCLNLSGGGAVNGWTNTDTWLGSVSTAWATAANWSGGVPTAASDVVINTGSFQPQTGGAVTVKTLTVNSNATLTVTGANMTVNGDISVAPGGKIDLTVSNVGVIANGNVVTDTTGNTGVTTCAGPSSAAMNLQAGSHFVTGKFCNLSNFGTYTVSGPLVTVGSGSTGGLQNGNGGNLIFNGHRVDAVTFANGGTGLITMTNALDSLYIHGGSATFNGGSETGLMTAGAIIDRGPTLTATGTGFDASGGSQMLMLDTAAFSQALNWNAAVTGHGFNNVTMMGSTQQRTFGSGNQWITGTLLFDASMTSIFGTVSGSIGLYVNNLVDNSTITGGAFNGSTSLHITGNGTFQHDSLRVNNVHFDGGGSFTLSKNLTTNYVVVDSGSNLIFNNHTVRTQGNSFTTQNGGVITMSQAHDTLNAASGTAYFNGGASTLTAGDIEFQGLFQGYNGVGLPVATASANSFSPTAGLTAHLNSGCCGNIAFLNPGTGAALSHFWLLQLSTSSTNTLYTDVFVDSLLLGEFSGANAKSDSSAQGIVRTITTKGVYNSGTFGMTLSGVAIVLNQGVASSTNFNSITWNSFPASYGGVLYTQNRTSGAPSPNFQTYSAVTFAAGGNFATNIGTQNLVFGSSITAGTCVSATLTTGQSCK